MLVIYLKYQIFFLSTIKPTDSLYTLFSLLSHLPPFFITLKNSLHTKPTIFHLPQKSSLPLPTLAHNRSEHSRYKPHRKTAGDNPRDGTVGDCVPPATCEDCRRPPKRRDSRGSCSTRFERERERRVGGGYIDGRRRWFADRSSGGGGSKLRQPVFKLKMVFIVSVLLFPTVGVSVLLFPAVGVPAVR
ncbi:hypothetical protein Hanom_Chr02g00121951 [Helianthus anomalus]